MPPITPIPLGTPVVSARNWAQALSPRNAGGWNWISQMYLLPEENPSEWVVMHLETGDYHIDMDTTWEPGDRGRYVSASNFHNLGTALRASNGRIFWPAISMWWWWYDPETEVVNDGGQVVGQQAGMYSFVFNHDGDKIYGGGIAGGNAPNKLPWIVEIDPLADPPVATALRQVGSLSHTLNAYAYKLWADGDWLYVGVGTDIWDCVGLHVPTNTQTIISQLGAGSWMFFVEIPDQGLTVQMVSNYNQPNESIDQFWVYEGVSYPYTPGVPPPFPAHSVSKYSNPVVNPPQIDSTPTPDAVLWRPNGSTGPWTRNDFEINYAAPVIIDSLYTLPTGEIFGNVLNYQGFFRYSPGDGSLISYGEFNGISDVCYCPVAVDGKIYMAGYPNGVLYRYDPSAAWNTLGASSTHNPRKLGNFSNGVSLSGVKRASRLVYSPTYNRLYMVGLRDRQGDGAGIGSYDLGTLTFAGTFAGLSYYEGNMGIVMFDALDRVVIGGQIGGAGSPPSAELILYDHNLVEIDRQVPIAGLLDTGTLYRTNEAQVVVGVSIENKLVYRWNIVTETLLGQVDLSPYGTIHGRGAFTQLADGTLEILVSDNLLNIDLVTLAVTEVGTYPDPEPVLGGMAGSGSDLFISLDTDLFQISGDTPTDYDLSASAFGANVTVGNATMTTGASGDLNAIALAFTATIRPALFLVSSDMSASAFDVFASIRDASLATGPSRPIIIDLPEVLIAEHAPLDVIDLPPAVVLFERTDPVGADAMVVGDVGSKLETILERHPAIDASAEPTVISPQTSSSELTEVSVFPRRTNVVTED